MIQSPTPRGKCFAYSLLVIAFFQLVIVVLCFMSNQYFLKEGIIGIFLVILLLAGTFKLSYQALMIHAFVSIFHFITFLVFLLTLAQNGTDINKEDFIFHFIVGICCCTFYLFTSIFMFFPYRQFKAMEFEQNPALAEFIQNSCSPIQRANKENQNKNNQGDSQQDRYSLGTLPLSLNLRKSQSNRQTNRNRNSLRNLQGNRNSLNNLPRNNLSTGNLVPTMNSIQISPSPNKNGIDDSQPNVSSFDKLHKQKQEQENQKMFGLK